MPGLREYAIGKRVVMGVCSIAALALAQPQESLRMDPGKEDSAAESAPVVAEPEKTSASPAVGSSPVKNPLLQKHLLDNVDIFGKSEFPAIYIFGPGDFSADQIDAKAITRDFAGDPFMMQNIDREEFEGKMVLRGLSEEKKEKEREGNLP